MLDQKTCFEIILHAGNAKYNASEALAYARNGEYKNAEEQLNNANEEIVQAHQTQTQLLFDFANGNIEEINILMAHAQDHLSNAQTFLDLTKELINVYKRINRLERRDEENETADRS